MAQQRAWQQVAASASDGRERARPPRCRRVLHASGRLSLCLSVVGCSTLPPPPTIVAVEPNIIDNSLAQMITVEGEGFVPRVEGNLVSPSQARVDNQHRVALTLPGGTARVWEAVAPRGRGAIDVTLPAAFPRGLYGIEITDPLGRRTARDDALRVIECFVEDGSVCKLRPSPPLASGDEELAGGTVAAITKDAAGGLWVVTDSGVVGRRAVDGATLQPVTPPKQAPVAALLADAEGNVWVGYDEDGCSSGAGATCACGPSTVASDGGPITSYCTDYLSTAMNQVTVMVLEPDTGDIYVGTGNDYGIYKASLGSIECDINFAYGEDAFCTAGAVDNSSPRHLWMGTRAGLFEFIPDHEGAGRCADTWVEHRPFGDALPTVTAVLFDHGGTEGRGQQALADDAVWVATLGAGMARLEANTAAAGAPRIYSTADETQILPSDDVYALALHPARRVLFVGTAAGLVRYDLERQAALVLTAADGLPASDVRALAIDQESRTLWIGTTAGLVSSPLF